MGDRGNIVVRQKRDTNHNDVWFYTHWRGSEIQDIARRALAKKERWDDETYLARIIFCELVKGDEKGATGFGISTEIGDNEYPILVVDCEAKELFTVLESSLVDGRLPADLTGCDVASFGEFIGGTNPRAMATAWLSVPPHPQG